MKPVENWLVSLSPNCRFTREKIWLVQLGSGTLLWSTSLWLREAIMEYTYGHRNLLFWKKNKRRVSEPEFNDGTATQKAVFISSGPWVNTISIIWELVGNANSWSHPRPLESESGRGKVRGPWICVLTQTFLVILMHTTFCIHDKEKKYPLKILEKN